ncbi:MAG TPA: hypothetical protein VHO25_18045, partial [Polyangiaceae bacterium]|nr:hypothetical protein [Polyangiaceae bacterium]
TQYLFGYSLFDAGSNIVNTIVQGITSMASAPVDAMMRIVGKIRNLLPFSPAKEGPLRDLHKVKLIETVAGAVNPTPLVDAMRGAAGTAMAAMTATPMPAFAAMPYVGSSFAGNASNGFGGGGLTMGDLIVQLGSATAREGLAELEAWLRNPTNVRRIAIAVKDHVASQDRAKF